MTRLQKKCLVGVTGAHLLLVAALLCSGFVRPAPRPDNTQLLDVIPARAIDAALQSGVRAAQPARVTPPAPQPPKPEQPPAHEPPKPEPKPEPRLIEPPRRPQPTVAEAPKSDAPEPRPKPQPHKIDVNLTPVVHKTTTEPDHSQEEAREAAKAAERAARRVQEARVRALETAARSIRDNAASATTVELPGNSSVAYANYASIVRSIYTREWTLPDNVINDQANVRVSVTIARDGHVIESHVVQPSGDSTVDASVRKTLDQVSFIQEFPDDATDKERTYIINFNVTAKRQLL